MTLLAKQKDVPSKSGQSSLSSTTINDNLKVDLAIEISRLTRPMIGSLVPLAVRILCFLGSM